MPSEATVAITVPQDIAMVGTVELTFKWSMASLKGFRIESDLSRFAWYAVALVLGIIALVWLRAGSSPNQ